MSRKPLLSSSSLRPAAALAGVLALTALGGVPAARAQGLSADDAARLNKLLGAGVLGPGVPSGPLAAPASLLPLRPATYAFQIASGANQGNSETDTLQPTTDGTGAPWQYQADQDTIYALRPAADGSLYSPSEQDLGEGALTRYDPPRPMLLAGAQPGVPQSTTLQVNVYDIGDPSTVTHTGTLTLTYTFLGQYQLTVPAGNYTASLVKQDYNGTIGPASVQDTEYWFYAAGTGPVAMIEKQDVSAFLVYNNQEKYGKVLVSSPQ